MRERVRERARREGSEHIECQLRLVLNDTQREGRHSPSLALHPFVLIQIFQSCRESESERERRRKGERERERVGGE